MPTPCTNNCRPNEMTCSGCGRTEKERLHWPSLNADMQLEIMERIRYIKSLEAQLEHLIKVQRG